MKDYSELWLDLMVQSRMMHNYSLLKDYKNAQICATNAKDISEKLMKVYEELQNGNTI